MRRPTKASPDGVVEGDAPPAQRHPVIVQRRWSAGAATQLRASTSTWPAKTVNCHVAASSNCGPSPDAMRTQECQRFSSPRSRSLSVVLEIRLMSAGRASQSRVSSALQLS